MLATLWSRARVQHYAGEIKLEPVQLATLLSRRLKPYAYDIQSDGALANKRLHCELGSDGMTLDTERNLYLTGNGVIVFDKTGQKIAHIEVLEP